MHPCLGIFLLLRHFLTFLRTFSVLPPSTGEQGALPCLSSSSHLCHSCFPSQIVTVTICRRDSCLFWCWLQSPPPALTPFRVPCTSMPLANLEDGLFGLDSRKNFLMEGLGQGNGGMPIPGSVTLLQTLGKAIFPPFSAFLAEA